MWWKAIWLACGVCTRTDEIALAQRYEKRVSGEEFQFWKLAVKTDHTATLTCDDGNGRIVFSKVIEFTDFPLPEISFYFTKQTVPNRLIVDIQRLCYATFAASLNMFFLELIHKQ
jgi:hypothetical protein